MIFKALIGLAGGLALATGAMLLVGILTGSTPPAPYPLVPSLLVALALALTSTTPRQAWCRLLVAAGIALLAIALCGYTFGLRARGLPVIPVPLVAIATLCGVLCLALGVRRARKVAAIPVPADSSDHTIVLPDIPGFEDHESEFHGRTGVFEVPKPRRWGLQLGTVAAVPLLLLATGWAVVRNRAEPPLEVPLLIVMPAIPAIVPEEFVPAELPLPLPEAAPPARPQINALTASAARRECMAQVESAHLFMGIARHHEQRSDYDMAIDEEAARIAAGRPVGPRTLNNIASDVWNQRNQPEPDAAWWSRQYQRCEAARLKGAWYVVRGG